MLRSSRRRIDPDVAEAIAELLLGGWTPRRVLDRLEADARYRGRVPSLRTVEAMAAELRARSSGPAWSLVDADAGDAALVLPVLGELAERGGRVAHLTPETAAWVVRLRRAAPALEPYEAFRWATRYQLAAARGGSTHELDLELARETTKRPHRDEPVRPLPSSFVTAAD